MCAGHGYTSMGEYLRDNPTPFSNFNRSRNQGSARQFTTPGPSQREMDLQRREQELTRQLAQASAVPPLPPALAAPPQPEPFDLSVLAPPAPKTFFGSTEAMRKQQKVAKIPAAMRRGTGGSSGKKPFMIPRNVNA